jgi:hypothetical protein
MPPHNQCREYGCSQVETRAGPYLRPNVRQRRVIYLFDQTKSTAVSAYRYESRLLKFIDSGIGIQYLPRLKLF